MRGLLAFALVPATIWLTTTRHAADDDVYEAPEHRVAPKHLQPGDDHGSGGHDAHHQRLIGRQVPQVAQIQHADGQPAKHAQGEEAKGKAEPRCRARARIPLLEHRKVPAGRDSGL